MKQLLAREVSREGMRRSAATLGEEIRPRPVAIDGTQSEHSPSSVTTVKKRPAELPKPSFFLGARPASKKHRTTQNASAISYRFQAGFTNAVKRPAVLADFL